MLVYRVEHKETGFGPYNPQHEDLGVGYDNWINSMPGHHPSPTADIQGMSSLDWGAREAYLYGFQSIDSLRKWFPDDYLFQLEHYYGFRLAVYDVPEEDVLKGERQVAFHHEHNAQHHRPLSEM